jgi:YVTN family beta-propeller protein
MAESGFATVDDAGTYTYHCEEHPWAMGQVVCAMTDTSRITRRPGQSQLFNLVAAGFFSAGLVACGAEPSPAPEDTTDTAPAATRETPPPYLVFVTNEGSGDLTMIAGDTHEAMATYPLGKRPRGIKVSPDGGRLYVALSGSPPAPPGVDESTLPPPDRTADGIGVVDVETGEVLTVLRGGTDPEQVALSPDGTRLYVANEDADTASILDVATGEILAALPVGGEPEGVTISPDGQFVYVTSEEDNQVSVISTASSEVVAQFEVGPRPRASAFSPDSARAYVTSENGGGFSVVDTAVHEVSDTIDVPGDPSRPMGVVVSPDGTRLYVSTGRGRTVVAMDTTSYDVIGIATVGDRPWGIALSPDGSLLYAANGPSNDVSVVDTETMSVIATVPAGERPWGIAVVSTRP